MDKRYFLVGLILVAIIAVVIQQMLTADRLCVQNDGLECTDPTGQVVTYWYQHRDSREETLQSLVEQFNDTNEWNIIVQAERAGSYGTIYDRLISIITSGGKPPSMSVAYQNQAATYALLDTVVELTPYVESPQWGFTDEELDDFFPFVAQADYLPQFQGRYGFPPQRSMEVLYYNVDWLSQLGYDHPPHTWEEFREMACAASDPESGTFGYELSIDASTFADMIFNRGGAMINEDGTSYMFADQAGLDTLTFLQDLFADGCATLEEEQYQDQRDFGAGTVLFTIGSTSGLPDYQREVDKGAGHDWSISTIPTALDTPRVNVYGASLSILKTTPEEQLAAWLFIKWLTGSQQSAYWSLNTGYFPVRKSAAADMNEYLAANPQFEKAFTLLENDVAIEPGVAGYDECRGVVDTMLEAVVIWGDDAETRLHEAQEECNLFVPNVSAGGK